MYHEYVKNSNPFHFLEKRMHLAHWG
jgi:hypothetical protein